MTLYKVRNKRTFLFRSPVAIKWDTLFDSFDYWKNRQGKYFISLSILTFLSNFIPLSPPQHLCSRGSNEIVKRWVNETTEALASDNVMVQYHAMGLLYHIRKKDRHAVSKMVTKLIRSSLRSPHGYCLLIRIACIVLEDEERSSNSLLYDFLEGCLRHKSEVRECG